MRLPNDAGEKQSEGEIAPGIWTTLFAQQNGKTATIAINDRTMKKALLFLKEPKAAPVLGTFTR